MWPANWWEIAVEDTVALVEELGAGPAVLVGQSGGGAIALMTGIRHPQVVRAIVSDSQVEFLPAEWLRSIVRQRQARITVDMVRFWEKAHGPDWQDVVKADNTAILARAEAGGIDWFQGMLRQIRCPVLLTGSLADRLMPNLPDQILTMARQIPRCSMYLTTNGGHPLMWTSPHEFRRVVESFLAEIDT